MTEFERAIRERALPKDVIIHAAVLVNNGWPVEEAIKESIRTLDDAELEGGY